MNLFKRIEVIILLILAAGGAAFVLLNTRPGDETDEAPGAADASGPEAEPDADKIHRCTLARDYGNARLDIELRHANRGSTKLAMQPPQVKLITTAGREVPPFFLPFDPPPEIPAGTTRDVRLRYWLEAADLKGGLKLVIGDEQIEVKSAAAFDFEKLKNKESKVFTGADWRL